MMRLINAWISARPNSLPCPSIGQPEDYYITAGTKTITDNVIAPFASRLLEDLKNDETAGWKYMKDFDNYSTRTYMSLKYQPQALIYRISHSQQIWSIGAKPLTNLLDGMIALYQSHLAHNGFLSSLSYFLHIQTGRITSFMETFQWLCS